MTNIRMAYEGPPPSGETAVQRFGTIARHDLSQRKTTLGIFGCVNSGLVQVGVFCALCLGSPEIAQYEPLIGTKADWSCGELPAGRPGKRRQKEMKQIPFMVEMTMKQPAYKC